jgi:hypothetical protein
MIGPRFVFGRLLDAAAIESVGAARMEGAAEWELGQIGRLAGDGVQGLLAADLRNRAEQGFGVRVARRTEQLVDGALFDDAAGVHHGHAIAHAGDDAQVVGDEQ